MSPVPPLYCKLERGGGLEGRRVGWWGRVEGETAFHPIQKEEGRGGNQNNFRVFNANLLQQRACFLSLASNPGFSLRFSAGNLLLGHHIVGGATQGENFPLHPHSLPHQDVRGGVWEAIWASLFATPSSAVAAGY